MLSQMWRLSPPLPAKEKFYERGRNVGVRYNEACNAKFCVMYHHSRAKISIIADVTALSMGLALTGSAPEQLHSQAF